MDNFILPLAIIFGFGIIIFVHEFGHFIVAKILKIKVIQFSFGLGPEVIGRTINDTRYSICLFPLGGAVKLKGENIEEEIKEEDSFYGKKWFERIAVVIMGPIMNYILAMVVFSFLAYIFGVGIISNEPIIGNVIENKPAYKIGLKQNDKIIKINNIEIKTWSQMAEIIHNSPQEKLVLEVLRNDKILKFEVVPEKDPVTKYGMIGITPGYKVEKLSFIKSIKVGVSQPVLLSIFSIKYLYEKIAKMESPELAGPLGIVQVLSKAARSGIEQFLNLIATISTMLGLFNLLPIPILDGGHVLFALIEGVTKKLPTKKMFEIANFIGLSLLVVLFLYATYSDIVRLMFYR